LLDLVRLERSVSIGEAADRTGLSRATVSEVFNGLRHHGVVVAAEPARSDTRPTGRPPQRFALNPRLGVAVGVEFEEGYVRVAVSDLGLTVLDQRRRSLPVAEDFEAAMDAAAEMTVQLLASAGADRSRAVGLVVSLPAPVNRVDGVVHTTTILPSWAGRRPGQELWTRLGVPVDIDNDASLGVIAETALGAAQRYRYVVYVKVSTGLGCGIVLDGLPYHGAMGTAGELGHLIVDEDGPICYCGSRGCLHAYVGARAITEALRSTPAGERLFGAAYTPDERLEMVIQQALVRGDPACQRIIRDGGHRLGIALASVCNLLNPECVVIGGVLSKAGTLLLDPLRDALHSHTVPLTPIRVEVILSQWQEQAEVIGALAQVLRGPNPRFRERLYALAGAAAA